MYSPFPAREFGSRRVPAAPAFAPPPRVRWRRGSRRDTGYYLAFHPLGLVLGSCNQADRVYDPYGDPGDYLVEVLDLESGELRFEIPGAQPVGLAGQLLLCSSPRPSTDRLTAFAMREGRQSWAYQLPRSVDSSYCVAADGFYAWPAYGSPPQWRIPKAVDFHPLDNPAAPVRLPGPDREVGFVREYGGLAARALWSNGDGEFTVFRERAPIWELHGDYSERHEILVDAAGFVLAFPEHTQAFSSAGIQLWSARGFSRCWVGAPWVVGQKDHELVAVDRQSGESQALGSLDSVSDVAVCGQEIWCLSRWHQRLQALRGDGSLIWEGPLDTMNVTNLVAYAGRLYLMTDLGEVICLEASPSNKSSHTI